MSHNMSIETSDSGEIDEMILDQATSHPEWTLEQFIPEFQRTFEREPTVAEKRTFQKAIKILKTSSTSSDSRHVETLSASSPSPSSALSKEINGYIFGKVLGKGSFGEVFECKKAGRDYAVKQIDESLISTDVEQSFADSISAKLNSKFIVKYFDKFRGPNKELYVAMELCPKGDLRTLIDKLREIDAILSTPRIMKIVIQLLLALYVLHLNKILHRDLKPENVFTDKDDNVKLGDFGCSKELDTTSQKANTQIGTPLYESAEVIRGEEYDSSADMWALGIMLYELVVLERPFSHANRYKLQELIFAGKYKPIPKERCPDELSKIIGNLLNKDPKQRPSAETLLHDPFIQKYATECQLLEYFPSHASNPSAPSFSSNPSAPSSTSKENVTQAPVPKTKVTSTAKIKSHAVKSSVANRTILCKPVTLPQQTTVTETHATSSAGGASTSSSKQVMQSTTKQAPITSIAEIKNFPTGAPVVIGYIWDQKYAFRVKCRDEKYFYGKTDKDIEQMCNYEKSAVIELSQTGEKTTFILKKDIIVFDFGACSVTRIGNCFLSGCSSLTTSPTIPNSVTSIGNEFLGGCSSLTTPPTIPNSVTSIENEFLARCSSLTTPPTIPNSVTIIGNEFLYGCKSLITPPTIPNSVTSIGSGFLHHCWKLITPPTIPNSVTSIGNQFLGSCTSLTTPPAIPNSVASIGNEFLARCSSLTTPLTIPNSLTKIRDCFLGNCVKLNTPPTIPNSVTSIGNGFLYYCSRLSTPPTIPNSVASIGNGFLYYCSKLTTPPTIPNSVTSIGNEFLGGCSSLTKPPTIPNSVTSIGNEFLHGCSSLTKPPTIPKSVKIDHQGFLRDTKFEKKSCIIS